MQKRIHRVVRIAVVFAVFLCLVCPRSFAAGKEGASGETEKGNADQKVVIGYGDDIPADSQQAFWPDEKLPVALSEYWGYRFNGPVEQAYQNESPYIQELLSEELYKSYFRKNVLNDIEKVVVLGKLKESNYLYELRIQLHFKSRGGKKEVMFLKDRWLSVGDRWYHDLRDPFIFPG